MNLTLDEICSINRVQMNIFLELIRVCTELNIKYYMVHGSLLGAVRYHDFFPFDDDIDVAIPRRDYEVLMKCGPTLFKHPFFLQSCTTELEYPLQFAKLRNTNTAFIQQSMEKFNINKGIYIDIFPIDYYPNNPLKLKWIRLKEAVYNIRISCQITYENKQPFWKSLLRCISVVICPSCKKAIQKRAYLFAYTSSGKNVILSGGKKNERGIPAEWFGEGISLKFSSITVNCPLMYKEYLSHIYGNYNSYDPSAKYMNDDGTVSVSAENVSTTQSYLYIEQKKSANNWLK